MPYGYKAADLLRREIDREQQAYRGCSSAADTSRANYMRRLGAFDPAAYARSTAEALGSSLMEDFVRAEAARNAALNARGIYGSPIGHAALTRDFNERLARALASLGMEAALMQQGVIDRYGDLYRGDIALAENSRNRYLDLLAGQRDYETALENERRRRRSGLFGNLGSLLGAAVGTLITPGIGTAIGAQLGGYAGRAVGG